MKNFLPDKKAEIGKKKIRISKDELDSLEEGSVMRTFKQFLVEETWKVKHEDDHEWLDVLGL